MEIMEDEMEDTSLSFDLLRNIEFRHPKLHGPIKPIDDHRILAGLLFRRWNDPIYRSIKYLTSSLSIIKLESVSDRVCSYQEFKVQNSSIEQLYAENCLVGNLRNFEQLFLSIAGGRRVVSEWFKTSAVLLDSFAAGAALNVESGKLRWT
jgi:hypothetical protein